MVKFLLAIIDFGDITDSRMNGMRISSVLVVICCLYQCRLKISSAHIISNILFMLKLMPDVEKKKCVDWEYVENVVPKWYKKVIYEGIHQHFMQLLMSELLFKLDWLFAIPIMHFLNGDAKPFRSIEYDPRKIQWSSNLIDPAVVQRLNTEECK